jgi:hypothetical protein
MSFACIKEEPLSIGRSVYFKRVEYLWGSMSLCVQAVLMASDAGRVNRGEHVIALTSDTAILAQSAPTRYMLTEFAVREVLCKPAIYSSVAV